MIFYLYVFAIIVLYYGCCNYIVFSLGDVYEIVIGSHLNSRVLIRSKIGGGSTVASADAPDVLSGDAARPFWISWEDGRLAVGRGAVVGDELVVAWTDNNPRMVRTVGLATGIGSQGNWIFNKDDGKFII